MADHEARLSSASGIRSLPGKRLIDTGGRGGMSSAREFVGMDFLHLSAHHPRLSGAEIRRLIELRERVKVESLGLPLALQRELLTILERARPRVGEAPPLPEMSRGELIRAIRWRLGTVPLSGAIAAAEYVALHRRRPRGGRSSASLPASRLGTSRQKPSHMPHDKERR